MIEKGRAIRSVKKLAKPLILTIVIRIGPVIEPARLLVCWFTTLTDENKLNHWFNSFGPDELNHSQILQTDAI
jgi:hypothetical protein